MIVNFEYVGVDASETLTAFTEEKLEKLLDLWSGIIILTMTYILLYFSPNLDYIKLIIPLLCAIAGWKICEGAHRKVK